MKTKELIVKDYAAPSMDVEDILVETGFASSGEETFGTRSLREDTYEIQWN